MSDDTKKLFTANLNTLLMAVVLAVMTWLGSETRSTALALAELRATATVTAKANTETLARLEGAVNGNVSRREYDSKLVSVEAELARINVRLAEISLAMAKLKR